jgi:membrane protein implicated in regulation of membrane protease activity
VQQILWWYWIAFGLALIALELIVPSFTIIWFGLGACCVGLVMLPFAGLPLAGQMLLWAAASTVWTVLWFRWLKPRMADRTKAGMSKDAIIGEIGIVVPVLGDDEWPCISTEALQPGDEARVVDIDGHVLRVVRK